MRPAARKLLLSTHVWAGLGLGVLLVVMAVSGTLLVFRAQLERRLDARRFVVAPGAVRLPVDALVARARAAHPSAEIESVRSYGDPTMPLLVYFTNREYVHLDPYTGAVLGVRQRYGEGFGFIEGVHKFFQLPPSIGEQVSGYTALAFSFIIVSGLILWWPATRRALKAGLVLNGKLRGRPWNLSLHKVVGAYAALVLLVSCLTGVPISLDWAKQALYPLTGSVRALPPELPDHGVFSGFGAAVAAVSARFPAAREIYVPLPKAGVVAAYAIEAGAPHPNARSYVWLESATGRIRQAAPYAQASAGLWLYYWMMSLHTGAVGGPWVQVILLLGALSVPLLAYTGAVSYVRRQSSRAAKVVPPGPALAPVALASGGSRDFPR